MPIAHNLSLVSNMIRQSQQSSQLYFYDKFVSDTLNKIEKSSKQLGNNLDKQRCDHEKIVKLTKSLTEKRTIFELNTRHLKYQHSLKEL